MHMTRRTVISLIPAAAAAAIVPTMAAPPDTGMWNNTAGNWSIPCNISEFKWQLPIPPIAFQTSFLAEARWYVPTCIRYHDGEGCHSTHIGWEFFNPSHIMRRKPTHWMPLPKPQADASGEEQSR